MCTYNGARYVEAQLKSIAGQTRPPDELIICDDCSSDRTREIIESFIANTSLRVTLHVNDERLGSTRNFERAIKLCSGDVIALSDQDDVWLPCKLMLLEKAFLSSPKVGLVFSDAEVVDENLRPLGYRLWQCTFPKTDQRRFKKGHALRVLLGYNVVTGATLAFRGQFKSFVLPFPNNSMSVRDSMIHDGWITLLIASVADIRMIEKPLVKYRQHKHQQLGTRLPDRTGGDWIGRQIANTKKWREAWSRKEIQNLELLRERLLQHATPLMHQDVLSQIEQRIDHIETRVGLPRNRLARVPRVFGELTSFRYHRYSKGWISAAKDLLF